MLTDEKLSAFLDGELNEAEMDEVRDAIDADEGHADRLAELASVDGAVRETYAGIDARPIPGGVAARLERARRERVSPVPANDDWPSEARDNVVAFPLAARLRRFAVPTAIAAGLAIAVGFGLDLGGTPTGHSGDPVFAALSGTPSGQTVTLADGRALTPRLTFPASEERICRQYRLSGEAGATDNVACTGQAAEWSLAASVEAAPVATGYATASGPGAIDRIIDDLIVGAPLDGAEERAFLTSGD